MDSGGSRVLPMMTSDAGCPVAMGCGPTEPVCARPLHYAPEEVDGTPVCLMHSNDPAKQTGPLFNEFWREFEAILTTAAEGPANFHSFVFPKLDLSGKNIQAVCRFTEAIFKQDADFNRVTFEQGANFTEATFTQYANFRRTTFTRDANFREATFTQNANFREVTFTMDANFIAATFTQNAHFGKATFMKRADFTEATFTKRAYFSAATFAGTQGADFGVATFAQAASFIETKFFGTAVWAGSQFLENVEFRSTKFLQKVAGAPSAVFALAHFEKPGRVTFDDVDLGRALFHNCDVGEVRFTSSARWRGEGGNREFQIFEETIPLNYAKKLDSNSERDYRAIAQIYQQLKKNYDTRLDYWTANQFHFGEMEMKRRALPTQGRLLGLRRRMHPWLSPVALYRWASDYGNSYWRPMIWLLGFLLLFALLFPMPRAGLERSETRTRETYTSVWRAGSSAQQSIRREIGLVGRSLLMAVDTATFQKGAEYAPAYPLGRVLAIAETLLTSSLFALFLLALRRQFRR